MLNSLLNTKSTSNNELIQSEIDQVKKEVKNFNPKKIMSVMMAYLINVKKQLQTFRQ